VAWRVQGKKNYLVWNNYKYIPDDDIIYILMRFIFTEAFLLGPRA